MCRGCIQAPISGTFASDALLSLKYFLYACLLPGVPWPLGRDGMVRYRVCARLYCHPHEVSKMR